MIMVGTKCDEEGNRKVKTEVAQKYVDELFKECAFIETSAKTSHNVQEAFQVINLRSNSAFEIQYRTRGVTSVSNTVVIATSCCRDRPRLPSATKACNPRLCSADRTPLSSTCLPSIDPRCSLFRPSIVSVRSLTSLLISVLAGAVIHGQEPESFLEARPEEVSCSAQERKTERHVSPHVRSRGDTPQTHVPDQGQGRGCTI